MKSFCFALAALAAFAPFPAVAADVSVRETAPAATLLLPYFFVSRNGIQLPAQIGAGGVDTQFRIVNAGATGLIVKAEVWNKYGVPLFGFNVPMAARDSFTASMRDLLNGHLNVNPNTQFGNVDADPCGLNQTSHAYAPSVGFGSTKYVRFSNPDSTDRANAISRYPAYAFSGAQRLAILDSLDESQEVTGLTYPPPAGVLDSDNPACGLPTDGQLSADFSGYVTFDVVNYCTQSHPDDISYYAFDALATVGWTSSGNTPNALVGSYRYFDAACGTGGDFLPMPAMTFEPSLDWRTMRTFYGKFRTSGTDVLVGSGAQAPFAAIGDARKPLGTAAIAEFQTGTGASSHLVVWRSDLVDNPDNSPDVNLANWLYNEGPQGNGFADSAHQIMFNTYDTSGAEFFAMVPPLYVYLCTQRYSFPLADPNPGGYAAGWMRLVLPGNFDAQAALRLDQKTCAADPNGDGAVSVADVFYLINFLFAGGAPPK